MAKPTVYLETTIISYLAGRTSRNVVVAGHQAITRQWWERRDRFDLFVSQAVLDEAQRGDKVVAARRAERLRGIPALDLRMMSTNSHERSSPNTPYQRSLGSTLSTSLCRP